MAELADVVEQTMRGLRAWSEPPPPLVPFARPFGMDAMPFEHWLQLVLVPRMHEIAARGEPLPPRSNLAAHAVREFDGRDELWPLIDVLRRVDELSPERPATATTPLNRRPGLAILFMLAMTGWAFVAVALAGRIAPLFGAFAHPRVVQSFDGATAPGADFRPLRITVAALVDDGDAIRATDASFVLVRSMRTMTRGPTAPLDFAMSERPTEAAVVEWLGDFGVDAHADEARAAAREALAVVGAAARARTVDALHQAASVDPRVRADEPVRLDARTPEWVELALVVALVLAGGVPMLLVVLRIAGRR